MTFDPPASAFFPDLIPSTDPLARLDKRAFTATNPRVALVGNFAPRKCGIATFTTDVFEQLAKYHPEIKVDVYALEDPRRPHEYRGVCATIASDVAEAYRAAAKAINESNADAIWLQHEYGIFGGDDGEMVEQLVDRIAAPLILTPHTVLADPSPRQRAILEKLVARSSRIMVMSSHSRDLLAEVYGAPHEILQIIPHGAPDRPFGRAEEFKQPMGLQGRKVLTTFGLLGPGKGLETAIEALPAIASQHPEILYRIVGATHPNLVAEQGETYREGLIALADQLGVAKHIEWVNRFIETEELLDQLEACDIYLTPYPGLQQSTSGTLSYAVALGKAVVSTPYLHARELLADGVGVLVEPQSSEAIAGQVNALFDEPARLLEVQQRAYAKGRETIWPRFAESSAGLISAAVTHGAPARPALQHAPSLEGVFAMSDSTGILQHSIGIVPDRTHGYCLDDNVRALMLMNLADEAEPALHKKWRQTYASFVQHAWNANERRFRNFMRYDRNWCEEAGSEDSNGRTLWALGQTIELADDEAMRFWSRHWYDTVLAGCSLMQSPRAVAFAMLGAAAAMRSMPGHAASRTVLERGSAFLHGLLNRASRPDWAWFEITLGYDNPRLSQALIEAGHLLDDKALLEAGFDSLAWICDRQTASNGDFRPVGSDSFGREFEHCPFDQQPLEAQAAIEAVCSAWRVRQDARWARHADAAWNWFFGANDRGVVLADLVTGRCKDGVNPRGANENCGAESILAFQLSFYSWIALRRAMPPATKDGSVEAAGQIQFEPLGHS